MDEDDDENVGEYVLADEVSSIHTETSDADWVPSPLDDHDNESIDDEIKDEYNQHWQEAKKDDSGCYKLNQIHKEFIANKIFKERGTGPDLSFLIRNFKSLPCWIKNAKSNFTNSDVAKAGSLAPMHLFYLSME